ncbi:hypothetical protein [Acidisoma sp.]
MPLKPGSTAPPHRTVVAPEGCLADEQVLSTDVNATACVALYPVCALT